MWKNGGGFSHWESISIGWKNLLCLRGLMHAVIINATVDGVPGLHVAGVRPGLGMSTVNKPSFFIALA